ncbi:glycoside hydrolase family 2 TIM barrel-domain containing protein [Paenibacillus sp.]|uniref:glycoside hydrolase family 2 TIM barrel-domain containing protein n=1 Tax=Paenibacillus sp. TaxID=58172 RepID=UPI002D4F8E7F|nr:glycoside hydrolase family 2 TIM barrel-domain containing protein [Paenibacillus sp.]HZG87985.1 glycoside hydrolase family 2 TIM barrel-domain containing protein [Paenibacillus sp.]
MKRTNFNRDWQVKKQGRRFNFTDSHKKVTLPHDAMLEQERDPKQMNGTKKGYFRNGEWEYFKSFEVPEGAEHVVLEFDGVYNQAMVYINGSFAGHRPYGYSMFRIEADQFIKRGETNEVKVLCRTADDSRWYSGAGIYRDVHLLTSGLIYIAPSSVRITTEDVSNAFAVLSVDTVVRNDSAAASKTVRLITELYDPAGDKVAADNVPMTVFRGQSGKLRQRLIVNHPQLWNTDTPVLYTCRTLLMDGDTVLDENEETFGIRRLSLDPVRGLCINGAPVKLRGACIHHDHGVIGAVSVFRAEERRIEILKAAGFNAIRMSHHPASRTLLEACDRIGMLVMDEAFDSWTLEKSPYDYALSFPEWWESDLQAMVERDYNHPCVVLYSIGNEIPEVGLASGNLWGRALAEKLRELDGTRYITNSSNAAFGLMSAMKRMMSAQMAEKRDLTGDINEVTTRLADIIESVKVQSEIGDTTEESFAYVDVAGYNYLSMRYEMDKALYPNRIIVGSETFPKDIDVNWRLVRDNPHVIGDFTWTGWDYLGEAGIGRITYDGTDPMDFGVYAEYPWLTSRCGDIDLTGERRPASYFREIVFGLRKQPYIAVQRPEHYADVPGTSFWSWSDSVGSWTWPGFEGKPIKIEVYSDADEVELFLNGESCGRMPAGEANGFKAIFDITYQPGIVEAVAFANGIEQGRYSLVSAQGKVYLTAIAERDVVQAGMLDLAYVAIELQDAAGTRYRSADRLVTIEVEGGELLGFGSANPITEQSFTGNEHSTYEGRAVAVIRPTEPGTIRLTARAEGCSDAVTVIEVK